MLIRIVCVWALHLGVAVAAEAQWNPQEQEVVDAIEKYLEAWNSSEAEALAALCDENYDRIDARGNVYRGREEILRHYRAVFARQPPTGVQRELKYEILSARLVGENLAIVDARYSVRGVGPRPHLRIEGMNTVVLTREGDRWIRVAHRQRIPVRLEGDRLVVADP